METSRTCRKCGKDRPLSRFSLTGNAGGQRRWVCQDCVNKRKIVLRRANPDAYNLAHRRYVYNLKPGDYEKILGRQGGKCPGCGDPAAKVIDHNHRCCPGQRSCGRCVRGVLCLRCNSCLGLGRDDATILRNLAAYLEGYK